MILCSIIQQQIMIIMFNRLITSCSHHLNVFSVAGDTIENKFRLKKYRIKGKLKCSNMQNA